MKSIKHVVMALVVSAGVAVGQGATNFSFNINEAVPEGSPLGLTLATNLTVSGGGGISDVTVSLDITGGFNGGLYAYLVGPAGGFAVLLNRTGVGGGNMFGYADAGFDITLDDSAANGNIHYYENVLDPNGGQLTGAWAPDGENVDPEGNQVGSAAATATLASFDGTNPDGTWELFVASLSGGDQSTLVSWGLTISTVPEPSTSALAAVGLVVLLIIRYRGMWCNGWFS